MNYLVVVAAALGTFFAAESHASFERLKKKQRPTADNIDRLKKKGQHPSKCDRKTYLAIRDHCDRPQGDLVDQYSLQCLADYEKDVPMLLDGERPQALYCRGRKGERLYSDTVDWCSADAVSNLLGECENGGFLDSWALYCLEVSGIEVPTLLTRQEEAAFPDKGFLCHGEAPKAGQTVDQAKLLFSEGPIDNPCDEEERKYGELRLFPSRPFPEQRWPDRRCEAKIHIALLRKGLSGVKADLLSNRGRPTAAKDGHR